MTFLVEVFPYEPPVGERELSALTELREVYGIRSVILNDSLRQIVVEYDATRLKGDDIAFMLRNAGIRSRPPIARAA